MTAPDIGALRALRDRVAAATGPDREIDQDLFCDLGLCPRGEDGILDAYRAPRYTESVDAALWLVERHGFGWRVDQDGGCTLSDADDAFDPVKAATPPLSVCAALLAAMIAQRGGGGA